MRLGGFALATSRRLDDAGRSLAGAVQRLSSGLRVNGARDDAAGLAIAERLLSRQRGAMVAMRNSHDAMQLVQTADGALGRVNELLQRLRELAVQSANGTLGAGDRALLQKEAAGLVDTIDRIGRSTRFNGTLLLDGSFEKMTLQIGAGADETLVVRKLLDVRAAGLPSTGISYSVNDGIDVSGGDAGAMPVSGLTAMAGGLTVADEDGRAIELGPIAAAKSGSNRLFQVVAAINAKAGETGISAAVEAGSTSGQYKVTLLSDRVIGAGDFGGFSAATTGLDNGSIADGPIRAEPINEVDLRSASAARLALYRYDSAIAEVSKGRARLGAMQARFESVITQLQVQAEAEQAARGRILDADFAAETAQRSRAAIVQQAGVAMLAQANLMPRQVLALLQPRSGAGR
jgi:flagellin